MQFMKKKLLKNNKTQTRTLSRALFYLKTQEAPEGGDITQKSRVHLKVLESEENICHTNVFLVEFDSTFRVIMHFIRLDLFRNIIFQFYMDEQCQRLTNCTFLANGLTAAKARLIDLFSNADL